MTERVNKNDVATRQLKESIRLFLERRDPIAIHTLVAAAHQVLYDICKKHGLTSFLKDSQYIKEGRRKEWLALLSREENFFKHADRDPADTLDFNPDSTPFMMLDAIEMYRQLNKTIFPEAKAFYVWFCVKYPEFIPDGVRGDYERILEGRKIDPEDRSLFMNLMKP